MNTSRNDSDSAHFSDVDEGELQPAFSDDNQQDTGNNEQHNQTNRVHPKTNVLSLLESSISKAHHRKFTSEDSSEPNSVQIETEIRKIMGESLEIPTKNIKKEAHQTGTQLPVSFKKTVDIQLQKDNYHSHLTEKQHTKANFEDIQTSLHENSPSSSTMSPSENGELNKQPNGRFMQGEGPPRRSAPHYYPGMEPEIMNQQYPQRCMDQLYPQQDVPCYGQQNMQPEGHQNRPGNIPPQFNREIPFNPMYPPPTNNQYFGPPPHQQQINYMNPGMPRNPNYERFPVHPGPNFKERNENQFHNPQRMPGPGNYDRFRPPYRSNDRNSCNPPGEFNPYMQDPPHLSNNMPPSYHPMNPQHMDYCGQQQFKPHQQRQNREEQPYYRQERPRDHSNFRNKRYYDDKNRRWYRSQDRDRRYGKDEKFNDYSHERSALSSDRELSLKEDKQHAESTDKKNELHARAGEDKQTMQIENSTTVPLPFENKKMEEEITIQPVSIEKYVIDPVQTENLIEQPNIELQQRQQQHQVQEEPKIIESVINTVQKPELSTEKRPKPLRKLSRSLPFKIIHHKPKKCDSSIPIEETMRAAETLCQAFDQPLTTNEVQVTASNSIPTSIELVPIQPLEDQFDQFAEVEIPSIQDQIPSVQDHSPTQNAEPIRFSPLIENEQLEMVPQQNETEECPVFPQLNMFRPNPYSQPELQIREEHFQPKFERFSVPFPNPYYPQGFSMPQTSPYLPMGFPRAKIPKFNYQPNFPVFDKIQIHFPNFQGQWNDNINKNTYYQNNNVYQQQQPQLQELSEEEQIIQKILDMGRQQRPETYEELKKVLRNVPTNFLHSISQNYQVTSTHYRSMEHTEAPIRPEATTTSQPIKRKRSSKPKENLKQALSNPDALLMNNLELKDIAGLASAMNLDQMATKTPKISKKSHGKISSDMLLDLNTPKTNRKISFSKETGLFEQFSENKNADASFEMLEKSFLKRSSSTKKRAETRLEELESVRTESTGHDSGNNPLLACLGKGTKSFGSAGRLTKTNSSKQKNNHTKPSVSKKADEKSYSELVKTLANFHNVDWEISSHPIPKSHPIKSLSGTAFWFYLSSQYFPRVPFVKHSSNELFNYTESEIRSISFEPKLRISTPMNSSMEPDSLPEEAKKELHSFKNAIKSNIPYSRFVSCTTMNENRKKTEKDFKADYSTEDDQWLLELRSKVIDFAAHSAHVDWTDSIDTIRKVELAELVSILENDLAEERVREDIQQKSFLYPKDMDLEDPLVDLKVKIPEEESYISLLEEKQLENRDNMKATEKESVVAKRPITVTNDADCQICNDGDYTDDNNIVFCSKCNISVHQGCYGIPQIPKGDWICNLCKEFGPQGRLMRCPLCTNRAGALKPTKLLATTNLFEHLNPEYHAFLKSYANSLHRTPSQKDVSESHHKSNSHSKWNKHEASNSQNKEEDTVAEHEKSTEQCLYYDYHELKNTYSENELKDEPKPPNVWVHVTCVQFLPELDFSNKNSLIEGLTKIHPDRFVHECSICNKKAAGATIACERPACTKLFHPECARRANYVLEIKDIDLEKTAGEYIHPNRRQIFVIYCEKHAPPLKIRHVIETKQRKEKEEIVKFCRAIERNSQSHVLDQKSAANHLKGHHDPSLTKKKKAKKKQDSHFLQQIETLKKKYPATKYLINLKRIATTTSTDFHVDGAADSKTVEHYEVLETEELPNDPNRELTPDDEIWKYVVYKGCTPLQKYNRYKKLMSELQNKEKTPKTPKKHQEEGNSPFKYVKTTGAQRAQKYNERAKEMQEKVQRTNPKPLKPWPNCGICSEKVIPDIFDEVIPACSMCGKVYHADCLRKKNPLGIAPDFTCENCKYLQSNNRPTIEDLLNDQDQLDLMSRSKIMFNSNQLGDKQSLEDMDPADIFIDIGDLNVSDKRKNPFLLDLEEEEFQNKRIKMDLF